METILCLGIFLALIDCACAVNCTKVPDGQYEMGCRSYAECRAGIVTTVNCDDGMVYNNETKRCDISTKVAPPCGTHIDCSKKNNGRYADMESKCRSWYTCWYGEYFGHNFCSGGINGATTIYDSPFKHDPMQFPLWWHRIEGTVFDESAQACNWPTAVQKPCGFVVRRNG